MSKPWKMWVRVETTLFETDEVLQCERASREQNKEIYTWCTEGKWNWLERGFRLANRLGYVLLPKGLPARLSMPIDPDAWDGDEDDIGENDPI